MKRSFGAISQVGGLGKDTDFLYEDEDGIRRGGFFQFVHRYHHDEVRSYWIMISPVLEIRESQIESIKIDPPPFWDPQIDLIGIALGN
jgi:hypothetical protein